MKELMEKWGGTPYPKLIRRLPEIDISVEGVRGWLIQHDKIQAVFFDIQPDREIPPHSHCAQWGFVLEGEMWLTIDGKTKHYSKGDWYYISEGITHSATFPTRFHAIDFFDDPTNFTRNFLRR